MPCKYVVHVHDSKIKKKKINQYPSLDDVISNEKDPEWLQVSA